MILIAKRLKLMFILGLVFSIVLTIAGVFLLVIASDGSTVGPATVIFIIAGFVFLLALLDLFSKPDVVIMFNDESKELLVLCWSKVSFPEGTRVTSDSKYFVIPITDIINVEGINKVQGGTRIFGALG